MAKKEPRTERVDIRFTKTELANIERMAKAESLNLSDFVRKTIFKRWESVKNILDKLYDNV